MGKLTVAAMAAALLVTTAAGPQADAAPAGPGGGDAWVLANSTYTPDDYIQEPFVGNGYLAQRLSAIGAGFEGGGELGVGNWPLYNDRSTTALVAGVYENTGTTDHISTLPTWSDLSFAVDGHVLDADVPAAQVSEYRQTLDMRTGTVTTTFRWTPAPGRSAAVRYEVLANRDRMHLAQVRASITPSWTGDLAVTSLLNGAGAQRITAAGRAVDTATDTATVQLVTPGRGTAVAETARLVAGPGVRVSRRDAVLPGDDAATAGTQWTVPVRSALSYEFTKYVGISTSNDPGAPADVARATVDGAVATGWQRLVGAHTAQWAALWQRHITVEGLPAVQTAVNSSFYLLYSSLREGVNFSIPPAGLSSDNYAGVIFWDADTWMFPSLLVLHPELARSIVRFRYDTLAAAEANARSAGYRGGSWAWDDGPTGKCGGLAPCSHYEDHLQADISLAQWQYYQATGDTDWLRTDGYPVLRDVAEFWASRVTPGADGRYHIHEVTGPDEYTSGVDDESATNAGAVIALRNATAAARVLGLSPDPSWAAIAENIFVATDADGTHPEYPGYTGQPVKQADTVLMTYPFGYVTDNQVAAADLDRYMPVTDTGGPAMTASVEAVVAAQVQRPGCLAYTLFQDSYQPFLRGAFAQFNETQYLTPSGGQSNPAFDFATGAGGFLQTFAYGFAGLRWDSGALSLNPTLPPQLSPGITITGLQYRGRAVDVHIGLDRTTVTLMSGTPVALSTPSGTQTLRWGRPVTVTTARPDLAPSDNTARCAPVSASSAQPVNQPAAAVDGNAVTSWAATGTSSSFTVTPDKPVRTGHASVVWGATRPESYTVRVQAPSGRWQQVAAGAVPATGTLDALWPPVTARAVQLTFDGGQPASIAELTVPDASAPDLVATLDAPDAAAPGSPFQITQTLRSVGGADARDVKTELSLPSGWSATPGAAATRGATVTNTWTVTAPANQPPARVPLTVTTTWQGKKNAVDQTTSTAALYVAPPVPAGTVAEAEQAILSGGASTGRDHPGYTGTGFVDHLYGGAAITAVVSVPAAGPHRVTVRYANWTGGQNPPYLTETRTITLVAGGTARQLSLPVTGSWDTWSTVTADVPLPAGNDVVQLLVAPGDSGSINLDSLLVG
ncbi:Trehalose and maltose hydrolase (possible phosphorylase) [Amycolatopsis sacchari]|uniref:Trehalose and maltose hydrolase (Possible phosphorylase) n=1 Tax=Amycolatopsis sacchari TaxID=115433 RepID=A0A1I3R8G0_9PSEU|nr:glycosyl hydrolase family 65 protein [Amycolatopsis sacchari]SFJ42618.1 Trehalose and maltose hydrolase (possible phosphorylase) [Amycolatopsis sacchari]